VKRRIKADPSLEGGFTSVAEGLRGFALPCTTGLSVPGFFAVIGLFPGSEGLFPEVRMDHLLPA